MDANDLLASVPELPASMNAPTAALWAATTLMAAGFARGWSADEMRQCLLFFVARTLATECISDNQLLAEFCGAIDCARRLDRVKH